MRERAKKLIACFLIAAIMVCAPFTNVPKNAFAAGEDTASGTAAEGESKADAGNSKEGTDSAETPDDAKDETTENKDTENTGFCKNSGKQSGCRSRSDRMSFWKPYM